MSTSQILIIAVAAVLGILIGLVIYLVSFFRKVEQGHALIVNTMRAEPTVTFTGKIVIPVIHKAEVMDISLKTIEIDRRGREGLICQDNIRADIKVAFFVRVNKTQEDVLKVAQAIGCERASDPHTLDELFSAKFSEALKTVGKQLDFEDLYKERDGFRDRIIHVIGKDLNGYVLEDAAIDYLEQTPLSHLDSDNILDSQGIRKITELTAEQHIRTNEANREEEMRIKQKDVKAREAILELERQQAEAEAKQQREIENARVREQAEMDAVGAEERFRSETARIETDEKLSVAEENKRREVEVAAKNRERAVAIEQERVERARQLEAIDREREVELQRIAKEKSLEEERKAIADVVRERIVVDKTVAEEEERIKELRVVSEAERQRKVKVIDAEAEAEQLLVSEMKAAEASEQAAKHKAREQVTLAEAELEATEKQAQAKIRLAEGIQAEAAAEGLAEVRVKEASAIAEEKLGMASVHVREAEAEAIEKIGRAEAQVEREKLSAQAGGLVEKFKAMETMGEAGREYEELRLRLEIMKAVELARLEAGSEVAKVQAGVLSDAVKQADIDIVGGESVFLDRLVNAVSLGKSLDTLSANKTVSTLFGDYLDGSADLPGDVKDVLSNLSADDLKSLTLSAFLTQLMATGEPGDKKKYRALLDAARKLGVDDAEA